MSERKRSEKGLNELSRRAWLQSAAGLAIGALAGPAMATHIRTKARKNFRLGISAGVYGRLPLAEAAARIKADGFKSVLTNYYFADVRFDPLKPDWAAAKKIVDTLQKHDIAVAAIYGYYNVIDPVPERRAQGEARMEIFLTHWKQLGCPIVSTETGTFNAKSQWLDAPENETEEGYQKCRAALQRWARLAEKTGAVLTLEVYWRNVIGSIDRAERLIKETESPALKLVMDPANYFRPEDMPRMKPMLKEMFQRLGPQIALAHAKDVTGKPDGTQTHPAAGLGQLDYPLYLRLLAELDRPLDVLLEHVKIDDVPRARDFVLAHIEKLP